MRKKNMVIAIIATALSTTALAAGGSDSYNLGSKTVEGVVPQKSVKMSAPTVVPITSQATVLPLGSQLPTGGQQLGNLPPSNGPISLNQLAPITPILETPEYPEQRVVMTPGNELYANYFTFGIGGFSVPNRNLFILDYYKTFPQYNLDTYVHAGHEATGQTGDNAQFTVDNLYLKGDWGNWSGILSNTNKLNVIPSLVDNSQTFSVNNNATDSYLIYHFGPQASNPWNVGVNLYGATEGGLPYETYTNTYFSLFAHKESNYGLTYFPGVNHYAQTNASLYSDAVGKYRTTSLNGTYEDRLQWVNDPTLEMNVKGGVEYANNSGQGEINTTLGVEARKALSDHYGVTMNAGQDSMNTPMRNTLNNFVWDPNVLPAANGQLQRESDLHLGAGGYFSYEALYSEVKLTTHTSRDMMVYLGETNGETTPIYVTNAPGTQYWTDLAWNNSYQFNEQLRGLFNYKYSTLKQVSYAPQNTINTGVVYSVGAYSLTPMMNYYQGMYGGLFQTDALNPFWTFDIKNSYQLSSAIALNLTISNILNATPNYKNGYPLAGRCVTFSVQSGF